MPARYLLKVETEFSASHSLRDYPGDCARMHGHNWKVEVEILATALDPLGMGIDFKEARRAARAAAERLDHRHLNEIEPFDRVNPTAENIAAFLFEEIKGRVEGPNRRLAAVTVRETDRAAVRYSEE